MCRDFRRVTLTFLPEDRTTKLPLLKVDKLRALVILNQAQLGQPVDGLVLPLLADQAPPNVLIEADVETFVFLLVLLDRQLPPHAPVLQCRLIAILHALEELGSLHLGIGILLGVSVHLDVDREQVLDRILLKFFLVPVLLISDGNETELVE